MKKNIFNSIFLTALLFVFATAYAAETDAEKATDKTLAALELEKTPVAAEAQKAGEDAFREDEFFTDETWEADPVAVVTEAEGIEVPAAKTLAAPAAKAAVKPKTSPDLDSQEMKRRWEALFSKEITPDSIAYAVKPGDSLYVIALKNHTTVDFIKKINGLKKDTIYPKMKLKIHTAPFSMVIDKSKNTLVLYSENVPVKKYSVATGAKNSTPVGTFKITDKLVNPTWFKAGAILPPGSPENALGTRWMGFDKPAYGIHGTIEPKTIGTQASEGCIRMLNEDVEELYSIIPAGTKVTVQD